MSSDFRGFHKNLVVITDNLDANKIRNSGRKFRYLQKHKIRNFAELSIKYLDAILVIGSLVRNDPGVQLPSSASLWSVFHEESFHFRIGVISWRLIQWNKVVFGWEWSPVCIPSHSTVRRLSVPLWRLTLTSEHSTGLFTFYDSYRANYSISRSLDHQ